MQSAYRSWSCYLNPGWNHKNTIKIMASAHLKMLEANSCFCFGYVLVFWDWLLKQQFLIHLRILPCIHFAQNSQTRKKNAVETFIFMVSTKWDLRAEWCVQAFKQENGRAGHWICQFSSFSIMLLHYTSTSVFLLSQRLTLTLSTFRSLPICLTLVFPESVSVHVLHTSSHAHCDGSA